MFRLEAVAQSATESEYEYNLSELYGAVDFQSDSAIRTWFEHKWLPHHEVRLHRFIVESCIGMGTAVIPQFWGDRLPYAFRHRSVLSVCNMSVLANGWMDQDATW